jgi:nucleoside-diphosphate-sugar epimerase
MSNLLIIGGGGSIGRSLIEIALINGWTVCVVALNFATKLNPKALQFVCDRNDADQFSSCCYEATNLVQRWDLVVDLIACDSSHSRAAEVALAEVADHIITLSTTLIYDRSIGVKGAIQNNHPRISVGHYGGYVDGKVSVEKYWESSDYQNWTLIRPHHILGPHTNIGCQPLHNRDVNLQSVILSQDELRVVDGGRRKTSFIHTMDVAMSILHCAGKKHLFGKSYNCCFPEAITGLQYFNTVAQQLGMRIKVKAISREEAWNKSPEWSLTALDHVYDSKPFYDASGYTPKIGIIKCIQDALMYPAVKLVGGLHDRISQGVRPEAPPW